MSIGVYRNQAVRTAQVLWVSDKHSVVCYPMPNGAFYFNTIPDINNESNYKAVTFESLVDKATDEQRDILFNAIESHLDELEFEGQGSRKKEWKLRHAVATCKRRMEYARTKQFLSPTY